MTFLLILFVLFFSTVALANNLSIASVQPNVASSVYQLARMPVRLPNSSPFSIIQQSSGSTGSQPFDLSNVLSAQQLASLQQQQQQQLFQLQQSGQLSQDQLTIAASDLPHISNALLQAAQHQPLQLVQQQQQHQQQGLLTLAHQPQVVTSGAQTLEELQQSSAGRCY